MMRKNGNVFVILPCTIAYKARLDTLVELGILNKDEFLWTDLAGRAVVYKYTSDSLHVRSDWLETFK